MLGESYNTGDNYRSKVNREAPYVVDELDVTGLLIHGLKQLVKDKKKWLSLVKNIVKKRKRTNV